MHNQQRHEVQVLAREMLEPFHVHQYEAEEANSNPCSDESGAAGTEIGPMGCHLPSCISNTATSYR